MYTGTALEAAETVARAMKFDTELELLLLTDSGLDQGTGRVDTGPRASSPLAYGNSAVTSINGDEQGQATSNNKPSIEPADPEQWDQFLKATAPPTIPDAEEIDEKIQTYLRHVAAQNEFLAEKKGLFVQQDESEPPVDPLDKFARFDKLRKNREKLLSLHQERAQEDMAFKWDVNKPSFRDPDTGVVNTTQVFGYSQTLIRQLHESMQGFNVGLTTVAVTLANSGKPQAEIPPGAAITAFNTAMDPKHRAEVEDLLKSKYSELRDLYRVLNRVPHKHVAISHQLNKHRTEAVRAGLSAMIFIEYAGDPEVLEAMRSPQA